MGENDCTCRARPFLTNYPLAQNRPSDKKFDRYWEKVYARIGLEYTSTSPKGIEFVYVGDTPEE
jgi:hypothetical protein